MTQCTVPAPLSKLFSSFKWSSSADVKVAEIPEQSANQDPWILSIDDDHDYTLGLKLRLQERGYKVVRAFDGNAGFRYAFEFEPVAILLDLYLPNTTGEEVLAQLRENAQTAHIPIAVVTGLQERGLDYRLLSNGANDVFHKPVPHSLLADTVDRYAAEVKRKK